MTNEEALECAQKLMDFCESHTCSNCLFNPDRSYCVMGSEFGPGDWELEHIKEETHE